MVLRPSRHKIGHFRDVLQANLWAWYGKTKPNATKACIHQSKEMYFNTSINIKLKPGLVDSYDDWPANKDDLFWFQRFIICRSLTYFNTYPLTYSPGTHMGPIQSNSTEENGTINEHMGAIKCSFQYQYTEFVLDKWQLNRLFVVVQAVHPPKTNSKLAIL